MSVEESILKMMRVSREKTITLAKSGLPALTSADLDRKEAEAMVEVAVRFLAGIDHLRQAVDEAQKLDDLDPAVNERAAEFASRSYEFGAALQTHAVDQVERLGGNANRVLYEAQKLSAKE